MSTQKGLVYVAGPMTGYPGFNFPAFDAATKALREDGWWPINPADHDRAMGFTGEGMTGAEDLQERGFNLAEALLWDLQKVAEANAIYLLEGWRESKGARAEHALAVALGKEIIEQPGKRLLGFGGRLASGKDALADHLVETAGYVKIGMSDALNHALLTLDPIIDQDGQWVQRYSDVIEERGYVDAKKHPEVRRLLQVLGTEVGREMIDVDVWVKISERMIRSLLANGKKVIITGVRYPNEVDLIERLGGRTVWVERPSDSASKSIHISESSVLPRDFQHVVDNDGTLEDLYRKGDRLVEGVNQ